MDVFWLLFGLYHTAVRSIKGQPTAGEVAAVGGLPPVGGTGRGLVGVARRASNAP